MSKNKNNTKNFNRKRREESLRHMEDSLASSQQQTKEEISDEKDMRASANHTRVLRLHNFFSRDFKETLDECLNRSSKRNRGSPSGS